PPHTGRAASRTPRPAGRASSRRPRSPHPQMPPASPRNTSGTCGEAVPLPVRPRHAPANVCRVASTARAVGQLPHPGWGFHARVRALARVALEGRLQRGRGAGAGARARRVGHRRATPPPRPTPPPRTRRTSQTRRPSLQSAPMSAAPGLFRPPPPQNEPVKDYAPESPEREELRERLEAMPGEQIELPLVIGGREIRTGDT